MQQAPQAPLVLREKRVKLVTRVPKVQLARLVQQAKRDKLVLRVLQVRKVILV